MIPITRADIPALCSAGAVYLNSGASGPPPGYVLRAMREAEDRLSGPAYLAGAGLFELQGDLLARARAAAAGLLGAAPHELALTQNTSHGINLAVAGLDWSAEDEVISTRAEHPGGLLPLYELSRRYGVRVKLLEPPITAEKVESALTPRTRLISLSHVLYTTGEVLPLREICGLARSRGVLTLADGAQSVGNVPVDVKELGVDLYALTGHKWLLGPEGMGTLYVRPGVEARSTNLGYLSLSDPASFDYEGGGELWAGARRFEGSTPNPALAAGFAAAAGAASQRGPEQYEEIRRKAGHLTRRLAELADITVHSPQPAASGLVSFTVEGMSSPEAVDRLHGKGFVLRSIPEPHPYVRASVHLFNTEEELDALADAVSRL
ncbi:aminotransferase class V-fold PLP-dependent enzyme [Rubrobacter taiwanensis]|uniref:aminotransferase class V-fold PLP-dependent enzyme n=1 Tax=Rubrobacter taiwanensis TaxID=185139 RepID=UPI00140435D8|nr:aminotransferase class V-fold PLP-dependent enzyme [Rubrobacter taiwanensis]